MSASLETPVEETPSSSKDETQPVRKTSRCKPSWSLAYVCTSKNRAFILDNVPSRGYKPTGGPEDFQHLLFSAVVYQAAFEATSERLAATLELLEAQVTNLDDTCNKFIGQNEAVDAVLLKLNVASECQEELQKARDSPEKDFLGRASRRTPNSLNILLSKGLFFQDEIENMLQNIPKPKELVAFQGVSKLRMLGEEAIKKVPLDTFSFRFASRSTWDGVKTFSPNEIKSGVRYKTHATFNKRPGEALTARPAKRIFVTTSAAPPPSSNPRLQIEPVASDHSSGGQNLASRSGSETDTKPSAEQDLAATFTLPPNSTPAASLALLTPAASSFPAAILSPAVKTSPVATPTAVVTPTPNAISAQLTTANLLARNFFEMSPPTPTRPIAPIKSAPLVSFTPLVAETPSVPAVTPASLAIATQQTPASVESSLNATAISSAVPASAPTVKSSPSIPETRQVLAIIPSSAAVSSALPVSISTVKSSPSIPQTLQFPAITPSSPAKPLPQTASATPNGLRNKFFEFIYTAEREYDTFKAAAESIGFFYKPGNEEYIRALEDFANGEEST